MVRLKSTKDTADRSAEIQEALLKDGSCCLEEGIYYAHDIRMPRYSMLSGCGANTVIVMPPETEGFVLKMQEFCTVQNLMLKGSTEELDYDGLSGAGKRDAIVFSSNYDGKEDDLLKATKQCFLSNLFIEDFDGSGIRCHNTGYGLDSGLYAVNCFIARCGVGINLDYWTEFNKFTNINMRMCGIACVNNGGNNVFMNCNFHGLTGMLMDNRSGSMINNSHGTVSGCMFDHCGHNKGDGIVIYNMTSRFLFSNCHFGYDSIRIHDTPGVLLNGCLFIKEVEIDVYGNSSVLVSDCIFSRPEERPIIIKRDEESHVILSDCMDAVRGKIYAPEIIVRHKDGI